MKSKRLTIALKERIRKNIKKFVVENIENSDVYKEFEKNCEDIKQDIYNFVKLYFPAKDIEVLQRYSFVKKIEELFIYYSGPDREKKVTEIRCADYAFRVTPILRFEFEELLLLPNNRSISNFVKDKIDNDQVFRIKVMFALNTKDKIQCEIDETMSAYNSILNSYTTTAKMLKECGQMERFIPLHESEYKPKAPEDSLKLIDRFEKSIGE